MIATVRQTGEIMCRRRSAFTLVHLLVVIALCLVLLAFLIPTLHTTRHGEGYSRVKCQSNLSQIGKALLLYSNENKGAFPQTHYVPDAPISLTNDGFANANPFVVAPTPATTNNIPAAMFLLIRTQDMTTEVFTCPQGTAERDQLANVAATQRGNFTGTGQPGGTVVNNVSYSFLNVYPGTAVREKGYKTFITAFSSDFAVAADISPLAPNDPTWKTISVGVPRSVIIKGNSRNHDGDGQNVLYADGHAEFQQTPLCGTEYDNIFTPADPAAPPKTGASGTGTDPVHATDSVLLINAP